MKFKAKIMRVGNDHIGIPPQLSKKEISQKITFVFSKNKIWFTKYHNLPKYFIDFFGGCEFVSGTKYNIEKVYDTNDNKQWQITFNKDCNVYVKMNWVNAAKCKLIHGMYWFQKDRYNWLKQVLIAGVISVITYLIGQSVGFSKGYQDGLKAGIKQEQQSNPQR